MRFSQTVMSNLATARRREARGPAAPAVADSYNPWPRADAILRGAPPNWTAVAARSRKNAEYQQYQDATAEEEGEYEDEDDGYMGV